MPAYLLHCILGKSCTHILGSFRQARLLGPFRTCFRVYDGKVRGILLLQTHLDAFAHNGSPQTRGAHACLFAALHAGKELYYTFSGLSGLQSVSSGLSVPVSVGTFLFTSINRNLFSGHLSYCL